MKDVTFLVVDDSATIRKLVSYVIRTKLGSDHILTASDGKEAVQTLKDTRVDLIISDWNMPGLGGDELLYYCRNDESYWDTPFIMVTTNNQKDFVITALQLGVTQYLSKPFTPAQLEQKIRASWNAAAKRRSERHAALPEHTITLEYDGGSAAAEAVNVSASGALLRLPYGAEIQLQRVYRFNLEVPAAEDRPEYEVSGIGARCVRLEADPEDRDYCQMGLEFLPDQIDAGAQEQLTRLLSHLAERNPHVITE